MPDTWAHVRGADLQEAFDSGTLQAELPSVQAIYMWKWSLEALEHELSDPDSALAWLMTLTSIPAGRILGLRLNHFLRIDEAHLGGCGLPPSKVGVFRQFLQKSKNRRWLHRYLRDLAAHAPALYVGETGNLPVRTRSHLAGNTDFGEMVSGSPVLDWSKLDFYYCQLGEASDNSSEFRKSIEYLTAVLTLAGFTSRPG